VKNGNLTVVILLKRVSPESQVGRGCVVGGKGGTPRTRVGVKRRYYTIQDQEWGGGGDEKKRRSVRKRKEDVGRWVSPGRFLGDVRGNLKSEPVPKKKHFCGLIKRTEGRALKEGVRFIP